MRRFLAPYIFDIKNNSFEDLIKSLEKLKTGYKDEKSSLYFRLNSFEKQKQSITGIIEYGTYGSDENVVNIETSKVTKRIENNESPLKPYHFFFEFVDKNRGLLILERKGNIGVRSIFYQGLKKKLKQNSGEIEVLPISIGLNKILGKPLKKIVIKLPSIPKEIDAKLGGLKIGNVKSINFELVITAKKNQNIISELIETLKEQSRNHKKLNAGIIYDANEEISIFVDDGNFKRTVYLKRNSVRSWIEIRQDRTVTQEAKDFIKEIMGSEELLQLLKII
jgi:hypothetical protein